MMARRSLIAATAVLVSALVALACGSSDDQAPPPPPRRGAQAALSAALSASAPLPRPVFSQEDFTPSDNNRDPFRNYADLLKPPPRIASTTERRQVLAERYSLDELKLVGIINGSSSRAMFVDPEGKGWIVTLGQLIGRAETVRGGAGGADYDLNWKVDRIRENDVVFTRETPGRPDVPGATRVIALRPVGDSSQP